MSVYKEAMQELREQLESKASVSLEALRSKVTESLDAFYTKHPLLPPRVKQNPLSIPDVVYCWTNYEPRSDHSTSLSAALIDPKIAETYNRWEKDLDEWHLVVADRLIYGEEIFMKHRNVGYKDYKVVLVGQQGSGPVSLHFTTKNAGKFMVCDLPQDFNFGLKFRGQSAADKYCKLRNCVPKVYATSGILKKPPDFNFSRSLAEEIFFYTDREFNDCILSKRELPANHSFVMTIIPLGEKRLLISHVITP